jgi:hypothetical protein
VSEFGNVTANFIVPIGFTLPREYWDQLTVLLMGIIIPAIAGWLNGKRQRRHLREYMRRIYEVNNKNHAQHTAGYLGRLKEIRSDIEKALANGNISKSQYDILNTKISEHSDQNNNRFTALT